MIDGPKHKISIYIMKYKLYGLYLKNRVVGTKVNIPTLPSFSLKSILNNCGSRWKSNSEYRVLKIKDYLKMTYKNVMDWGQSYRDKFRALSAFIIKYERISANNSKY